MTVTLELKPDVEQRLQSEAAARGMPIATYLQTLIEQAAGTPGSGDRTLALLAQWQADDATDDPSEIAARNRDCHEMEANLKANRVSFQLGRPR